MADFISGVIGQLGRPMVKADQFNGIANALGRGIEAVGKREQLQNKKTEEMEERQGAELLRMMLQDPDNAQKYFQDGYKSQIFDEEWAEGLFPDGQFNSTQAQQMLAGLDPDYAKQQFGYGQSQDLPSSVRETQWFNQQSPEVQAAHMKLKRGEQLTPQQKLDYQRSLAEIKAGQKGKEIEAVTSAETKVSDAVAKNEANKAKSVQLAKDSASAAKAAQSTFGNLKNANAIYDRAIAAIDKGAKSGALTKLLPTIRSETLELQNAIRQAGLNTISGVTLGAISKPELELALAVDIPESMDEKELKPYLQKKKAANIKLMKELNKMSSFLSKKGNTVAMWNEKWGGDTTFDANDRESLKGKDRQALEWAENNPNDPRAKQILLKLGM